MDHPADIVVRRFSEGEISIFLYFLVACLFLGMCGLFIGLWLQSGAGSLLAVFTKPVKIRKPLKKLSEGDLSPRRNKRKTSSKGKVRTLFAFLFKKE